MNIYINARFLLQRPTGVERYAYEMCRALVAEGLDITLVCPSGEEIHQAYDYSQFRIVRFGKGHSHVWEQLIFPFFFINKKDYVVISFTGLGSILVRNKIMTVHDLSFLVNPSWFSKFYYYYYRFMTPLAIKSSKAIITVSHFSKSEIRRFYPFIEENKIHVIYNAADSKKFQPCQNTGTEEPYFLSVASIDPRKNIARLVDAFSNMKQYKLKIVGGGNSVFGKQEKSTDQKTNNIEWLGRVSDQELIELYTNAIGFIFPSLYEGFGLPPIEAMSIGCPVLTSNIPVLQEICGDAVMYFNPEDTLSIQQSIEDYCSNRSELSPLLIKKGKENIKRFSWSLSAKKLIQILTD